MIASPGIVVIRVSDERVIVEVVAGSAANEAVLASNVNAVAKSTGFIGFVFLWLETRRSIRSTLRLSCPVPADIFREGLPETK